MSPPRAKNEGETWSGELFDINIVPTAVPADYMTDFTIIGGSDDSAQDDLATQSFTVSIPAPPVPEASTWQSLGALLLLGGIVVARRQKRFVRR